MTTLCFELWIYFSQVCVREAAAGCRDECDLLVPGEQRGNSSPTPQGNDLCWPRWLRAHATGESTLHTLSLLAHAITGHKKCLFYVKVNFASAVNSLSPIFFWQNWPLCLCVCYICAAVHTSIETACTLMFTSCHWANYRKWGRCRSSFFFIGLNHSSE